MFVFASQSRKSIAILSAGAAALLLTGLGVSSATAASLTWDPGQSASGGTNGSGNWNSSGTYWYNGTTNQAWANANGAVFGTGTGGSGSYTVTVGSSGYSPSSLTTTNSGNTYVLTGGALTTSGQLAVNGNLTLQNITLTDTSTNNTNSSATGMSQASGATLVVGNGAKLDTLFIGAGVSAPGTVDVNSGGYLGGSTASTHGGARIQINYGPNASGSALNVNGGTVSMVGSNAVAWLCDAPSTTTGPVTGAFTLGVDNTGGTVSVGGFNTSGTAPSTSTSFSQLGTLNVDSGTLTTQYISSNAAGATTVLNVNGGTVTATNTGSVTSNSGGTTIVNLNAGTLSVHAITESGSTTAPTGSTTVNFNGGTLQENNASVGIIANAGGSSSLYTPTNLNVLAGGAIVDTNGYSPVIYNPLLTGTAAGTTDGGLTVENSDPSRGGVSINSTSGVLTITGGLLGITGTNTYTGPTVINSDSALQLQVHTGATGTTNGGANGVATIPDTSLLQIDSGGALVLIPDGVGTTISVGGLNLQSGIISLGFDGGLVQNLLVGSKAAVSGTNIINLSDISNGKTAVPTGTYPLIADTAGGLTGTFQFGNGSDTATLSVGSNTYTGTLNNTDTAETLTVSAVPEPTAVALLALGGLGLLIRRRKASA